MSRDMPVMSGSPVLQLHTEAHVYSTESFHCLKETLGLITHEVFLQMG